VHEGESERSVRSDRQCDKLQHADAGRFRVREVLAGFRRFTDSLLRHCAIGIMYKINQYVICISIKRVSLPSVRLS